MKSTHFISSVLFALALPAFFNTAHAQKTEENSKVPSILYKRAAFALGADAKNLKITNVEKDGLRTDFDVAYAKKSYRCYVTGSFSSSSDAICVKRNGSIVNPTNNPLLKRSL